MDLTINITDYNAGITNTLEFNINGGDTIDSSEVDSKQWLCARLKR